MKKINLLLFIGMLVLCAAGAGAGTAAYWRFEEGPAGALVPHGTPEKVWDAGTMDSSGNGYHLSSWLEAAWCGEVYRTTIPFAYIPLTGEQNNFSLQNGGDLPGLWTDHETLDTWAPTAWTVEAWVRCTSINNWRVAVGRDGDDISGDNPAFRIMFTNGNAVRASFCDMSNTYHELNTANNFVTADRWYHLAATSDGSTFILYVDGVEMARKELNTANTAMSNGSNGRIPAADANWHPGGWTVFRGMWNGGHTDRWFGFIDEVRISDTALTPSEFLNNGVFLQGPDDRAVYPDGDHTAIFTVTSSSPVGVELTDVAWYKDVPSPDTPVVPDGIKYAVHTEGVVSTLTVYNAAASDAANYRAVATFSNGSTAQSSAQGRLYIRSGLVHRYSFEGDITDSISGAHGAVIDPLAGTDPRTSFADGQLHLNNYALNASAANAGQIAYVQLPAGIVSALDNFMTIEMWLTPHRNANWTTFFAFGDTLKPDPFVEGFTGGRVGILGQLNRDLDGARGPSFTRVAPGGGGRSLTCPTVVTLDEEIMYTATWDGNTNTMRHYVNGILVDSDAIDMKLSDIDDVKCWLGLPFWGDPVLNASLNELRIYDSALAEQTISEHYALGPELLEKTAGVVTNPVELLIREEGSTSGEILLSLEYAPDGWVLLTVEEQDGRGQVSLSQSSLLFTTADWNVPQAVQVTAVDDAVLESAEHRVRISIAVSSPGDPDYDGLQVSPVMVKVADNECGAHGYALTDFTLDCVTDLYDLAVFAEGWLACSDPDDAGCIDFN